MNKTTSKGLTSVPVATRVTVTAILKSFSVLKSRISAFESPADFTELTEYEGDFDYFNPENEAFYLGDIMISEEKALDQAEDYGHSYVREIAFLIAHSVLHLIGYDHMLEEDAAVMEHKQSSYLEELGITREL